MNQIEAKTRLAYESTFNYQMNPQDFSELDRLDQERRKRSLTKPIDRTKKVRSLEASPENLKAKSPVR